MSYDMFVEGLRFFDALVATTLLGVLMFRTVRFWWAYDRQQKCLVIAFALYLATVAYTSFELYAQHATIGYRSYVALVANMFTIYAFAMNKKPGLMTRNEYVEKRDDHNTTT